jgi:hypothetical protein
MKCEHAQPDRQQHTAEPGGRKKIEEQSADRRAGERRQEPACDGRALARQRREQIAPSAIPAAFATGMNTSSDPSPMPSAIAPPKPSSTARTICVATVTPRRIRLVKGTSAR